MVSCSPQDEPTGALHASVRGQTLKLGLRYWRYCRRMGSRLQLSLHFPLRPYQAAVDCSTCRSLHGSDATLEVFDYDQPCNRPGHCYTAYPIGVAAADEKDGKVRCYCLFWAWGCLCVHLIVEIQ